VHAPLWVAVPVIVLVAMATRADVQSRKIPNVLTGPAFLLGILAHLVLAGRVGAGNALLGAVVAGAILLPGWLMGYTGAGDVKLMAAVGAWLGYPDGLAAAIATLIAGGVIAVVVAVRRGMMKKALRNTLGVGLALLARKGGAAAPEPVTTGIRFPFAPAILVGVLFALLRRG
jgi:prepilin peptidase CpaA